MSFKASPCIWTSFLMMTVFATANGQVSPSVPQLLEPKESPMPTWSLSNQTLPLVAGMGKGEQNIFQIKESGSVQNEKVQPLGPLQPGFDPQEYITALRPRKQEKWKQLYASKESPLFNQFELWQKDENTIVLNIRGTVPQLPSWLENFYAAMMPAKGSIRLNDSTTFSYQLAKSDLAMVHTGWLVGLGYMAGDMVREIKKAYASGATQLILIGHSQGGALAFLTRSYFGYLPADQFPQDLKIKTYCSAAPKPGNLHYAYDFDFLTKNGWAFRVVNSADWVPETPFSIQTLKDYNPLNPFTNIKPSLKKQPFYIRWYANGVFNKMDRRSHKASKTFSKVLGNTVYKQVKRSAPQLEQPNYAYGHNYQTAGTPIILLASEDYFKKFGEKSPNVFLHHGFEQYEFLLLEQYQ
jgi:hypothetical protein